MKPIQRIVVYVGPARPSHDTAPHASALLTDSEYRTLRERISRYVRQCVSRRGKEGRLPQ